MVCVRTDSQASVIERHMAYFIEVWQDMKRVSHKVKMMFLLGKTEISATLPVFFMVRLLKKKKKKFIPYCHHYLFIPLVMTIWLCQMSLCQNVSDTNVPKSNGYIHKTNFKNHLDLPMFIIYLIILLFMFQTFLPRLLFFDYVKLRLP